MRLYRTAAAWIALALPLAGLAGCSNTSRDRVETAAANVLIPPDEEKQLGAQVNAEISQQVRFLQDSAVNQYVGDMCKKIFAAAQRERPDLSVAVHVIDDPKTVNAFATPGEQLYVYSGLLLAADSDAEIAGVLGHETGHIVARHPARQMVDAFGLDAITSLVLGKNAPLAEQLATSVAEKGFMLANSRSDETEADEYGALLASEAGYDPNALARFLTRISAGSGEPTGVLAWLSDHPTTPKRVSHLKEYIAAHHLSGRISGGNQLSTVKARLQAAPSPEPPRSSR